MVTVDSDHWSRRRWLVVAGQAGAAALLTPTASVAGPSSSSRRARARINVSLNESAYGPSPQVARALTLELRGLERYTGDEARALVRQISELEGVAEEQVLLGEVLEPLGLQLGLNGGPGGDFLFSEPGYTALVDAARPVGGVGVPVPLNARQENDLPTFGARLTRRSRAVFLVNPHNPSGTLSEASELRAAVADFSKKALVVVDEAYLDYQDDWRTRSLVELVRAGENVVVFRTFSKLHGLAALPLGYAVAPRKLADDLRRSGLGSPRSLNRLAVRAASVSLRDTAYLEQVRARVRLERERYQAVFAELKLRSSAAQASFVFFESKRPQPDLAAALAAEDIDIGRAFPPLLNWTRISIGLPAENQRVQAALRRALA